MGKGLFARLAEEAGAMPGRPIVELAGDGRILIEHHFGIKEYGRERITVNMKYGQLRIQGEGLEILRMTRDQLVIRGTVGGLTVQRREEP